VFGVFGDEESARRAAERLAGFRQETEETKTTMTIAKTVSRAAFARRARPLPEAQRG
jgi:16S rRNA C1402 N4-methylase RsmH